MRLGQPSFSGVETWFPKETVSISTKLILRTLRKLAPPAVRSRQRNSLWRYAPLIVNLVALR